MSEIPLSQSQEPDQYGPNYRDPNTISWYESFPPTETTATQEALASLPQTRGSAPVDTSPNGDSLFVG